MLSLKSNEFMYTINEFLKQLSLGLLLEGVSVIHADDSQGRLMESAVNGESG